MDRKKTIISHRAVRCLRLWCLACLLAALPAAGASGAESGYAYEPSLQGIEDQELRELLIAASDAFALKDNPPPTLRLLRRRAEDDLGAFRDVLDSRGYFEAEYVFRIETEKEPPRLVFSFEPGRRFIFSDISIEPSDKADASSGLLPGPEDIGLEKGGFYQAGKIVRAGRKLLDFLSRKGRPFAEVKERKITAYHDRGEVEVLYRVRPGPEADFGETRIRGLETVEEEYVRSLLPWEEGERYDSARVDTARRRLFDTGLFSQVRIVKGEELVGGGLPLTLELAESNHRTVKTGLEYASDFGPGVRAGWEHRNLLGQGERLEFEAVVNAVIRRLDGVFRKDALMHPEQDLVLRGSAVEELTEAFTSRRLESSVNLERDLGYATASAGVGYLYTHVEDKDEDETSDFGFVFIPLSLVRDTSNDTLDPSAGYTVGASASPHFDTLGSGENFFKYMLYGRHYLGLDDEDDAVLASRLSYGSIIGAAREQIPADLRYYAGGGGTVRGYAYQTAGPLDEEDEPIGGKSILSASLEIRFKLSEKFGVSPFVDAGRAFRSETPDFDKEFFYGAGLGVQYYSEIGPLRLDIATPLNKREVDGPVQFYISLGQAF